MERLRSMSFLVWISKLVLHTTTPGAALSSSYKPHCREDQQVYPNGNQRKEMESILDITNTTQVQWPYY